MSVIILARNQFLLEVTVRTVVDCYPKDLDKAKEQFQDSPVGMFVDEIKVTKLGVKRIGF